jgi:hypothetical protein
VAVVNHSLLNNSILPVGAATVRRALVQHSDGVVREHRTYFHDGEFKTVYQTIDTINRGVLLPAWKLPGGPRPMPVTLRPPVIAQENQFQQTGATAPVGRQGALKIPLPNYAKQGRLFGAPARI